jgi:hypothetical protein
MRIHGWLIAALALLAIAPAAHGATLTVNSGANAGDGVCSDGTCTLRDAITEANGNGSAVTDEIDFAGATTVVVTTVLPSIATPVLVNGSTTPGCGATFENIALDGNGAAFDGLTLAAGSNGSRICKLNIRGFDDGIRISSDGNTVDGCRIGTDPNGETADPNNAGIAAGGNDNTIGGLTDDARNIVSGNTTAGISLQGEAADNSVVGNYVGLDKDGTDAIPNDTGVDVSPDADSTVGSLLPAGRNIVSGNTTTGVEAGSGAVRGNYIGTGATGMSPVPNGTGVIVAGNATIGGASVFARNVISGNDTLGVLVFDPSTIEGNWIGPNAAGATLAGQDDGIRIDNGEPTIADNVIAGHDHFGIDLDGPTDGTVIQGNLIGLLPNGTSAVSADKGINVGADATGTQIGGTATGDGNTIAGNDVGGTGGGIDVEGDGTVIEGNVIGLDEDGNVPGLVQGYGVAVSGLAGDTRIGGTDAGARNVISGHSIVGVSVGKTSDVTIQGNWIGLGTDGSAERPNDDGISVGGSSDVQIGGTAAGAGNVISANDGEGIEFGTLNSPSPVIEGNLIGLDAGGTLNRGNGRAGIHLVGVTAARVGGTAAGAGNVVAHNDGDGIEVESTVVGASLLGNTTYDNGGGDVSELGIDLDTNGLTANDAGDGDAGANNRQNFPVLTSAGANSTRTEVIGTIDTTPGRSIRVEVFSSAACATSGHGEGEVFLGAFTVTAGTGATAFTASVGSTGAGRQITATATDLTTNDTSEFSQCDVAGAMAEDPAPVTTPPATTPVAAPVVGPIALPVPKFPAKIRVLRNGIDDGVLDMLIEITARSVTPGAVLSLDYHSSGRHTKFTVPITGTQIKVRKKLPSSQPKDTGITTVTYAGNSIVDPDEVRLRAADGKSLLKRGTTSLVNGKLTVNGTVTGDARGVVRIRMSYAKADGSTGFLSWNATIDDGEWEIVKTLTGDAAKGGQLSIQFTGYEARNLRGEQTAKEVLA